jgi:DnaJ-class molecular chaperone
MAGEQDDDEVAVETAHGPRECMPCRGTGKLISNLGGEPSTVVCPWCDGGGVRLTGVDAQVKWLDGAAAGRAAGGPE